jgi:predicted RNase H-like nuclease
MAVVGVDACKGGWVAVALDDAGGVRAVHGATLDDVSRQIPEAEAFAVDIPIGLPRDGVRQADVAARRVLGPRAASLFTTPVRQALLEPTHARATAVAHARTGRGVSQQAYALGPKILEAEGWAERSAVPVWEVHPEVSFTLLLGHPAAAPKRTWGGMWERLGVLERAGIVLGDLPEVGGQVAVDDVLDAAAAAWSAARLVRGAGRSFPDPPERDPATGRQVAMWA